jgi:deoxyribose-phosphate aldolase
MSYTKEQIARVLDLAVLKPTVATGEVIASARLVQEEDIASICVAPCNVRLAKQYTDRVCAVIGFPHGNTTAEVKAFEARQAIANGAIELDVVCNYGRFLDGMCGSHDCPDPLWLGLGGVLNVAHDQGVLVKAILETCFLDDSQIRELCEMCVDEGVDFVKTSTGFGRGGATVRALKAMRQTIEELGSRVQIKASGGIDTYAKVARCLDLGCTRIGSSHYQELLP